MELSQSCCIFSRSDPGGGHAMTTAAEFREFASERRRWATEADGDDQLSEAFDQLMGEISRNLAFPPCPSCGKAMVLAQVMPPDDIGHEERVFKCPNCGTMESKILNGD
jgi:predicted RNA-binding Zn-ribbon protein involved in translation (DUF1610 family)